MELELDHCVECEFGILINQWWISHRLLNLEQEYAVDIIYYVVQLSTIVIFCSSNYLFYIKDFQPDACLLPDNMAYGYNNHLISMEGGVHPTCLSLRQQGETLHKHKKYTSCNSCYVVVIYTFPVLKLLC